MPPQQVIRLQKIIFQANNADINKIMRCAYGADIIHQNLAIEALRVWEKWNVELKEATEEIPGLTKDDVLYVNNGKLVVTSTPTLSDFEIESMRNMKAVGHGDSHFVVQDAADNARARENGYGYALDPFHRQEKGKQYCALLDTAGGFLNADKACCYALHKARSLGVNFIFGPAGTFKSFIVPPEDSHAVVGATTEDGTRYEAAITIAAGGGWTPTIVPELDGLCETTAGSVFFYQIPRDSPLWDRFSPENFPSYSYAIQDGSIGGIYGFPRDSHGKLKIGYVIPCTSLLGSWQRLTILKAIAVQSTQIQCFSQTVKSVVLLRHAGHHHHLQPSPLKLSK